MTSDLHRLEPAAASSIGSRRCWGFHTAGFAALSPLVMLAIALLASGCQQRAEFVPPPPPDVTVAVPLQRPVQEYFEAPGQTRAVKVVELRSRVEGYLKEIHFQDGELVSEGQLLFVIDQAPYQATLASANATLAKAQAQLQLSEQELARTQSLAARQVTTESDLDIRKAERASAAADVALAEAALQQAQLDMDFTQIRAPFAGRMGRHLVDAGNLVQKEMTLLTTLESDDPIHAYFNVSESDLLRFREMQRDGTLHISDEEPFPIELALGDAGKFAFHGQLDFREFGINPETGTTQRRAVFPNADGRLIPGLFVRIRAAVGDPVERLLVEERAISSDQRGPYLLVVDEQNVVQYRPVKLGLLLNGLRAIESGLSAGERVIVNGLQRARPSAEVTPTEVAMGDSLSDNTNQAADGATTEDAVDAATTQEADSATADPNDPAAPNATNESAADPQPAPAPQNE